MRFVSAAVALTVAVVIAAAVIGAAVYGAADTVRSGGFWGVAVIAGGAAAVAVLSWRDSR